MVIFFGERDSEKLHLQGKFGDNETLMLVFLASCWCGPHLASVQSFDVVLV